MAQPHSNVQTDYADALRSQMHQVGISSFKALAQAAQVSDWQVRQLRRGKAAQLRGVVLHRLSQTLQIPIPDLLTRFSPDCPIPFPPAAIERSTPTADLATLQQEYQRLQTQLTHHRDQLWQEFQQTTLQQLESWLMQWPTAAHAVQQNPQLPASRLLPLVRPIEQLLQRWGIEAIAPVGSECTFDPQWHQLLEGSAHPGDRVRVRYAGYRQGDRLLYRAKVSPLPPDAIESVEN